MSNKHLTVKAVADELSVSVDQIKKLITRGDLEAINVGVGDKIFWRISRADLDSYLAAKRAATAKQYGGAA